MAENIESDIAEVPIAQSAEDDVRLKGSRECNSAECAEEKRILREEVEMLKKMIRALVAEAPKKVVAHDQKRSGKKSKKTELQKLKHHIQKLESALNWYKLNVTDILNVVTHQQDVRDHLLSSYKEEIEVKVAQVKQYQKQVEAYRAECAKKNELIRQQDEEETTCTQDKLANNLDQASKIEAMQGPEESCPTVTYNECSDDQQCYIGNMHPPGTLVNESKGELSIPAHHCSEALHAENNNDAFQHVCTASIVPPDTIMVPNGISVAASYITNAVLQTEHSTAAWPNPQCDFLQETHTEPQELEDSLPPPIHFQHHQYNHMNTPGYNCSLHPHANPGHATIGQSGGEQCYYQLDQSASLQGQCPPNLTPEHGFQPSQYSYMHGPGNGKVYLEGGRKAEVNDELVPYDPNLICPHCKMCFRKGQIQLYRSHVQMCTL